MGILVHDDVAFGWFWMALLATALIPVTLSLLVSWCWSALTKKRSRPTLGQASLNVMSEKQVVFDHSKAHKAKLARERIFSPMNIVLAIGWIIFAIVSFHVLQHTTEELLSFDPYKILGLEVGADVPDIKKAYRKLSLEYHPDRNLNNPAAEQMFIRVSKAYQTLTDDAARENWEKYGNPDGYSGARSVQLLYTVDVLVSETLLA